MYFNRGTAGSQEYAREFSALDLLEDPELHPEHPEKVQRNHRIVRACGWLERGMETAILDFIGESFDPTPTPSEEERETRLLEGLWFGGQLRQSRIVETDPGEEFHALTTQLLEESRLTKKEKDFVQRVREGPRTRRMVSELKRLGFRILRNQESNGNASEDEDKEEKDADWGSFSPSSPDGSEGSFDVSDVTPPAANGNGLRMAAYELNWLPVLRKLRDAWDAGVDVQIVADARGPRSPWTETEPALARAGLLRLPVITPGAAQEDLVVKKRTQAAS